MREVHARREAKIKALESDIEVANEILRVFKGQGHLEKAFPSLIVYFDGLTLDMKSVDIDMRMHSFVKNCNVSKKVENKEPENFD